jgi:hypothetical protein
MQLELLKKPKPKEATTALHCFPLREGSSLEEQRYSNPIEKYGRNVCSQGAEQEKKK